MTTGAVAEARIVTVGGIDVAVAVAVAVAITNDVGIVASGVDVGGLT